ncbi:MAG: hypothetical protein AB1758_23735 [Candidatus Eremiobacterota bacterium]
MNNHLLHTTTTIDKRDLLKGFAFILSALEQAAALANNAKVANVVEPPKNRRDDQTGHSDSYQSQDIEGVAAMGAEAVMDAPGSPLDNLRDSFIQYEENPLEDGRRIRRYEDGNVRLLNDDSGVIQEERVTGKLLISLPNGKVIYQDHPGEPLLVYDTTGNQAPTLARVSLVRLPGQEKLRYVYNFADTAGTHLVDIETLQYFMVPKGGVARPRRVSLNVPSLSYDAPQPVAAA